MSPTYNDKRFLQKFCRRFCLPYHKFIELVHKACAENWLPRWTGKGKDCIGNSASPLELLILGSLQYLGRGFSFDDSKECTAISEEVHRCFFHKFIDVGRTILFYKYVITPTTADDAKFHLHEFEMAGMPGAVASVDTTHIVHENCTYRLNRPHKGGKSKQTTRTFNLAAKHRCCILATTKGHPSSWNDKTLVLFDTFFSNVKHGRILEDNEFHLLKERNGKIIQVKYRGVWFLVDNGYLSWAITVPPFTDTQSRKEIWWSECVESMRKYVECTFGILKGHWHILKSVILLHGTDAVDGIWLTSCALHNMLLEVDGLELLLVVGKVKWVNWN
eukprot:CCRYP_006108-RA/>CCRYP_006108-RA protein AED:0.21 eAED:0.21 QI:0/-1/0/1/-1/0/1/0/331